MVTKCNVTKYNSVSKLTRKARRARKGSQRFRADEVAAIARAGMALQTVIEGK
jgi:hypothetical protein